MNIRQARSFNPRPAWMLGATCIRKLEQFIDAVSILAQLGCWALRLGHRYIHVCNLFQSSPSLDAGRYTANRSTIRYKNLFQSSPSLDAGRYTNDIIGPVRLATFQSSPSLDAGRYVLMQVDS